METYKYNGRVLYKIPGLFFGYKSKEQILKDHSDEGSLIFYINDSIQRHENIFKVAYTNVMLGIRNELVFLFGILDIFKIIVYGKTSVSDIAVDGSIQDRYIEILSLNFTFKFNRNTNTICVTHKNKDCR